MRLFYRLQCLIFPERCPYCGKIIDSEEIACADCHEKLDLFQKPIIRGTHGYRCVSSFVYDGKVRRMILRIKYHERTQYLAQVAKIMEKDIRAVYRNISFDCITTVPMHKKDQEKRGYNQSRILAIELSKLLGIPYSDTLNKVKRTKEQHSCSFKERKTNLRGAFSCIDKKSLNGLNILIIDDIITSGETLAACCKELNKGKPQLLCCATIANAQQRLPQSTII